MPKRKQRTSNATLPTNSRRKKVPHQENLQESSSSSEEASKKLTLPLHLLNDLQEARDAIIKALYKRDKEVLHFINTALDSALGENGHDVQKKQQQAQTGDPATASIQAGPLIEAATKWVPDQDFFALYMRWCKKNKNEFQTDSLAVLHCVMEKYQDRFGGQLENLFHSRFLRFKQNTSSKFGHTISFTSTKDKSREDDVPSITSAELSSYISMFDNVVCGNASLGKIGMRNAKGSGLSATRRSLFKDVNDVGLIMRNLQEFHLPSSFRNRIERCIDARIIAFHLCNTLFKSKPNDKVIRYSFHLTEGADHPASMYMILAGVCLLFQDVESEQGLDEILHYYFNETNYKNSRCKLKQDDMIREAAAGLRRAAIARVHLQFSREATDHDIAVCIKSFHDDTPKKCGGVQFLHSLEKNRARKYHMIQCYIYEYLLSYSKAEKTEDLLETVLKGLGTNLGSSRPSRKRKSRPRNSQLSQLQQELNDTRSRERVDQLVDIQQRKKNFTFEPKHGMYLRDVECSKQVDCSATKDKRISSATSALEEEPVPIGAPVRLDKLAKDGTIEEWKSLKLRRALQSELDERCESHLHIQTPGEPDIVAGLPVVDAYSADRLDDFRHGRSTGPRGHLPPSCPLSYQKVHPSDKRFVSTNNRFSCVRPGDPLYQDHLRQILETSEDPLLELGELVRAVYRFGSPDPNRSDQTITGEAEPPSKQHRLFISSVGQKGDPDTITGLEWVRNMEADPEFDSERVLATIGRHSLFAWLLMKGLQESSGGPPLAPDRQRDLRFSENLRKFLKIEDESFCIEDITVCCGILHPNHDGCSEHNDVMNDWRPGYTRTGVFQTVLIDINSSMLIHVQFIINFRKKVGEHTQSFATAANQCTKNILTYNNLINDVYKSMMSEHTTEIPTGLNRDKFDASVLPFKTVTIHDSPSNPIEMDLCLPRIGCSRVLSYSMFIEPIVRLRDHLKYDQILELCFGASLLNSPVGFYHILIDLGQRHVDPKDPFRFGSHPFFDWMEHSIEAFNERDSEGNLVPQPLKKKKSNSNSVATDSEEPDWKYKWHLAFEGRFSTCGGVTPIPVLFGAYPGASKEERDKGGKLLSGIVSSLYEYTEWIDDLATRGLGKNPVQDLPMDMVEKKMEAVVTGVKKVAKCQFELFRLGLFTTIVTGAGLLTPGPHLHHLAIPTGASYDHLVEPQEISINGSKSIHSVNKQDFDRAMQMIAVGLNIPYSRTIIETLLCEAQHSRVAFVRYDWFIRGGTLYDLSPSGKVINRHFGDYTHWTELNHMQRKSFAFLPQQVMYESVPLLVDDTTLQSLEGLKAVGKFMDCTPFNIFDTPGRRGNLPPHVHKDATFYYNELEKGKKIKLLHHGVGEFCTVDVDAIRLPNDESFHKIFQYFRKAGFQFEMLVVRKADTANTNAVTCFKRHVDKLGSVALLPLDVAFWTILERDDPCDQTGAFNQWLESLPNDDQRSINALLHQFKGKRSIYYCRKGSFLAFQAQNIHHATIIPRSMGPRHLCILHEKFDHD